MAAITLYVGLYHLLIYFRGAQRVHLMFALMCFAMGAYDVFCAGLYSATSVTEGAKWQRGQIIILSLTNITLLWFVANYTGQISKKTRYLFSAFSLLAIIVQLLDRSSFTWLIDQPAIKEMQILGLSVTYYEVNFGPFTTFKNTVELAMVFYLLWVIVRFHRRGHQQEAKPLFAVMGIFFATLINDMAVSSGVYDFIYLSEYGYMGIVLLMTYHLSTTVLEAKTVKQELRKSEENYRILIENMTDWVWETDIHGIYTYVSPSVQDILGYEPDEVVGKNFFDLISPEQVRRAQAEFERVSAMREPIKALEIVHLHKDGYEVHIETNGAPFFDADDMLQGYRGINRDISKQKRVEAEQERLQQEIIDAQRQTLQELSTPIIPVMDQIIVIPLIGSIDTLRARDITRALLAGIGDYRAKVVILDITGVPVIDSGVASYLNKSIQAARLKGAHTIITGISDAVAETIVDLGIDWSEIETLSDLQTGLVTALNGLGFQLKKQES